jgi:hypothetical protein
MTTPTPTGERAQQHPDKRHEALDLAEWLVSEDMPTGSKSCAGAADMLAKQHALIVQMREALNAGLDCAGVCLTQKQLTMAGRPHKWRSELEDFDKIEAALSAANDYLEQS